MNHSVCEKDKGGKEDFPPRINIHDSEELKRWAERLEVTEAELKDVVIRIGPAADAVAEYLRR